jgi:hypothetical protein
VTAVPEALLVGLTEPQDAVQVTPASVESLVTVAATFAVAFSAIDDGGSVLIVTVGPDTEVMVMEGLVSLTLVSVTEVAVTVQVPAVSGAV